MPHRGAWSPQYLIAGQLRGSGGGSSRAPDPGDWGQISRGPDALQPHFGARCEPKMNPPSSPADAAMSSVGRGGPGQQARG